MIAGQAVAFILILQTALVIEAEAQEMTKEVDAASSFRALEMSACNIMLDCCQRLRSWASNDSEPEAEIIQTHLDGWKRLVQEYLSTEWGVNCTVCVSDLCVVPMANQSVDAFQVGFLGISKDERWYVSSHLTVILNSADISFEATYVLSFYA